MELEQLSDDAGEAIVKDAFSKDPLLEHYVETRGQWERIVPIIARAAEENTKRQIYGDLIVLLSFTVRVDKTKVSMDKHDWDRLLDWVDKLKEVK